MTCAENTNKSVLVTGASGFVGSHLVRRLVRQGCKVNVLVRPKSSTANLSDVENNIEVYRFSDYHDLAQCLAHSKPDLVFHLAAYFLAEHEPDQVEDLVESNITFGTQLAEAMVAAGSCRLVNVGTSWQHFNDRSYDPVNLYAATKQAFEVILEYYHRARGLRSVTLKLFDTYGPGDRRKKLFTLLREAAKSGERLPMSGGEQLISLVYIEDVVEALLASSFLVGLEDRNPEFAAAADCPISVKDLVALYSRITRTPINVYWGGRPYRQREVLVPWSKGVRPAGWTPKVSLEEGIRLMESGVAGGLLP